MDLLERSYINDVLLHSGEVLRAKSMLRKPSLKKEDNVGLEDAKFVSVPKEDEWSEDGRIF